MRPQSINCGNFGFQVEAASDSYAFNEAAVYQLRKLALRADGRYRGSDPSMRPQSINCGNSRPCWYRCPTRQPFNEAAVYQLRKFLIDSRLFSIPWNLQ